MNLKSIMVGNGIVHNYGLLDFWDNYHSLEFLDNHGFYSVSEDKEWS